MRLYLYFTGIVFVVAIFACLTAWVPRIRECQCCADDVEPGGDEMVFESDYRDGTWYGRWVFVDESKRRNKQAMGVIDPVTEGQFIPDGGCRNFPFAAESEAAVRDEQ